MYLRISAVDWTYPLDAKLTYCLLSGSACLTALRPIWGKKPYKKVFITVAQSNTNMQYIIVRSIMELKLG